MKRNLIFLFCVLLVCSASFAQVTKPTQAQQPKPADSNAYANSKIAYKIMNAQDGTYGYDIYIDGKLTIHQPSVPAIPGNKGFKTPDDAIKVAELAIKKIRKGEMPPTLTTDELKRLKVIE